MHDMEAKFHLSASKTLFCHMSDIRETAICCFEGITHISEKDFLKLLVVNIGYV